MTIVLRTRRLVLVTVEPRHLPWLRALWTDPRVMTNVGFPHGIAPEDLHLDRYVARETESQPPGRGRGIHMAIEAAQGTFLGEAKLGAPDESGTCEPDVKLLPEHWRRGYGEEVVRALVAETFARWPDARRVRFTPNVDNGAARALYAAVGARLVGRGEAAPGSVPLRGFAGVRFLVFEVERPPTATSDPRS